MLFEHFKGFNQDVHSTPVNACECVYLSTIIVVYLKYFEHLDQVMSGYRFTIWPPASVSL